MRDRLEKFIKTEGLTPSRFAEIMGVQPSSISHILGGRNKPSFDFIEKMLQRFPKLNPDWLLLGKGNIYRSISDNTVTHRSQLRRHRRRSSPLRQKRMTHRIRIGHHLRETQWEQPR